jgi:hypothetical protein
MVNLFHFKRYENGEFEIGYAFWIKGTKQYTVDFQTFPSESAAKGYLVSSIIEHVCITLQDICMLRMQTIHHDATSAMVVAKKALAYINENRKDPLKVFQCIWAARTYLEQIVQYVGDDELPNSIMMCRHIVNISKEYYEKVKQDTVFDDIKRVLP